MEIRVTRTRLNVTYDALFSCPPHHNLHRNCVFKISDTFLRYEQHSVKISYFVAFLDITLL